MTMTLIQYAGRMRSILLRRYAVVAGRFRWSSSAALKGLNRRKPDNAKNSATPKSIRASSGPAGLWPPETPVLKATCVAITM